MLERITPHLLPLHVPVWVFAMPLGAIFVNNMHFGIGFPEILKVRRLVDAAAVVRNIFLTCKPIMFWIAKTDDEPNTVVSLQSFMAEAQK